MGSTAGRAYNSDAISFLVVGFELFGTTLGEETRAWAQQFGWPVLWCEPLPSQGHQWAQNELGAIDGRVLDLPLVHTVNRTNRPHELESFEKLWKEAGAGGTPSDSQRRTWWKNLEGIVGLEKRVESLRAGRGAAHEGCLGISADGDCVCKHG